MNPYLLGQLRKLLCWHKWKYYREPDYPELDSRICQKCGRREWLCV